MQTTLKEIRKYNRSAEFWKRVKVWQEEHHTTACPDAKDLNLIRIAYSMGTYGVNGTMYIDVNTGEYIGVPERGINIYIR